MRRTKENAEKTRQSILDKAEELFLINGVSRTSLEMISRETEVTRGAVYWHFKDKRHLVHEMFSQARISLEEITRRLNAADESDNFVCLYDLCVECMEKFVQPGQHRRIMTILMHRCDFTQEMQAVEHQENTLDREFLTLVESIFDSQPHRLQQGVTPRSASLQLHSLFYGTLAAILRDQETFEPLLDIRLVFSIYFRCLLKDWT